MRFLKILISLLVIFVCIIAYNIINPNILKSYCLDIIVGSSFDEVNEYSLSKDLYLHNKLTKETNHSIINNHASPYFRMACEIELDSGIVTKSNYIAGD